MRAIRCLFFAAVFQGILTIAAMAAWEKVPPPDWSKIKLSDFNDNELDLPYYVANFHVLANSVVEDGKDRGFITGSYWRGFNDPPYNARVIENYESLAFFYCTDRPWNPYRGSPAVRERLEAVLKFWCDSQGDNGEFAEYAPHKWGVAPTAFATKFMGRTLELLKNGPPIDPDLYKRVIAADRKTIMATFNDASFYDHGKSFTNQYSNVFGGAACYLSMYPDAEVSKKFQEVFDRAAKDFQSPAGFFYEMDGADFGYTLHTHHSDMVQAYNFVRGAPMGNAIQQQQQRWVQWLSYNLLREPDGSTFVLNREIESRQHHAIWSHLEAPWGEKVELARAFATSQEEHAVQIAQRRAELIRQWDGAKFTPTRAASGQLFTETDSVGEEEGGGLRRRARMYYTPYSFLDLDYYTWYPSQQQRDAAVAQLPYIAKDQFVHQRVDDRFPLVCTFIKRPSYYAIFNEGTHRSNQQRYGLGILWNKSAGTMLQSQSAPGPTWGTVITGQLPEEAKDLSGNFFSDGHEIKPVAGATDLPAGEFVINYPLGKNGSKTLMFDDNISVEIKTPGEFFERLPLLVASEVKINPGSATATYGKTTLKISYAADTKAAVNLTDTTIAGKKLVVLTLAGHDAMKYQISVTETR